MKSTWIPLLFFIIGNIQLFRQPEENPSKKKLVKTFPTGICWRIRHRQWTIVILPNNDVSLGINEEHSIFEEVKKPLVTPTAPKTQIKMRKKKNYSERRGWHVCCESKHKTIKLLFLRTMRITLRYLSQVMKILNEIFVCRRRKLKRENLIWTS